MFFNNEKNRRIFKISLLLIILTIVVVLIKLFGVIPAYKTGSIEELAGNLRTFKGLLFFIALYSIRPLFVVLPASPMAVAAGGVYGPVLGTVIVVIGALVSGTVGFFVARFIGKDYLDKITNRRILLVKSKIEEGSWATILFLNFIGVSWDIVSISAGLSKIRFRDYLLAISISSPIQSFIFVYLGNVLFSIRSFSDLFKVKTLVVFLLVILGITLPIIIKKRLKKKGVFLK